MLALQGASQVGAPTLFEVFDGLGTQSVKLPGDGVGFKLSIPSLRIDGGNPIAHLSKLLGWELLDGRLNFWDGAHDVNYTMPASLKPPWAWNNTWAAGGPVFPNAG